MIYIAGPYSHKDKKVVEYRMDIVEKCIAALIAEGKHATSPLLMHYVVDKGVPLPTDFKFWGDFCLDFLKRCDSMSIITLPGWDTSRGVQEEVEFCRKNNIPVNHISVEWILSSVGRAEC